MLSKTRIRLGQGVEGACVSRMETLVVNDLSQGEPRFLHTEMAAMEGFKSVIATPLIAKGQPLGVLEVFHHKPFEDSRERQDALEAMATAAAIAVDNARLLESSQRKSMELEQTYQDTLEGWASALELRDYETEGHSRRVTGLSDLIGRQMGLDDKALEDLGRGALLHDVGKMAIPDQVLLKPGKLTNEEWDVMRLHPQHGYRMVSRISYLKPAAEIVYAHHEKWDGTGYPRQLKGAEIPVGARIFAITDVFDALRSRRPYKEPWPLDQVIAEIEAGRGNHFDPECVEAFLRVDRQLLW
jgi:HD-GYP domain-containing protein (c-di-GMP phosphodiesterase class II)